MSASSPNVTTRPLTTRHWLLIILATAIFGSLYIVYSRANHTVRDPATLTESPVVGYLAPDFTLPTAAGETIQLSQLRGRPVVLNFWATWCGPCRIETPHFQAVSEEFADDIIILGVNQQETAAQISGFAAEFDLTYPLLIDADNHVNQTYAVFGLPTTYFINADGIITAIAPGAINQAVLQDHITTLIHN